MLLATGVGYPPEVVPVVDALVVGDEVEPEISNASLFEFIIRLDSLY